MSAPAVPAAGQRITRRALLRSACRHCMGLAGLAISAPGMAQAAYDTAAPVADTGPAPQGFARPDIDSDEGGLWALMDRQESRLRRSPLLIRDALLSTYLRGIVVKLAPGHSDDIRIHVVRTPQFNASMAPNGMMQVWSGLLLRAENEAQLASVLGHELAHYLEKHSLERLRDMKGKAALAQLVGLFGLPGAIGQVGMQAGLPAFSRGYEVRADRLGMQLMAQAGYDSREAVKVWDNLLAEARAAGGADAGSRSPLFSSHPPPESRRDDLQALLSRPGGRLGAEDHAMVMSAHRMGWIQDEIRRGQFEESLILFDRMLRAAPDDAQALFARGEVYRQRAGEQDIGRALDDLRRVTGLAQPPAQAFRSLGLVHRQRVDGRAAVQAFEQYLAAVPDAPDVSLIRTYMAQLKP